MVGLLIITALGIWIILNSQNINEIKSDLPKRISDKLDQLWVIAQQAIRDKKYLRAEKALLTILRVDERNATAYNRLGILYAKQKSYQDSIECFEIAQSLESSPSSLHNVGLIYYETGDYIKAAIAFEQALKMEDDISARYIAYAKVQEKLGNNKKMLNALEKAIEIDPIPQNLTILADAYEKTGQHELALKLRKKSTKIVIPNERTTPKRQVKKIIG